MSGYVENKKREGDRRGKKEEKTEEGREGGRKTDKECYQVRSQTWSIFNVAIMSVCMYMCVKVNECICVYEHVWDHVHVCEYV